MEEVMQILFAVYDLPQQGMPFLAANMAASRALNNLCYGKFLAADRYRSCSTTMELRQEFNQEIIALGYVTIFAAIIGLDCIAARICCRLL
jgi:hypothetical protein